MLKTGILAGALVLATVTLNAQKEAGAIKNYTFFKYVVTLKDKGAEDGKYNVLRPGEFLSERSVSRRRQFSIPVTEQDFPLHQPYIQAVNSIGGVTVINRSRWMNHVLIGIQDTSVLAGLRALPFVKEVRQVFRGSAPVKKDGNTKSANEDASAKSLEGSVDSLGYGSARTQVEMLGLDYIHRKGFMGQGIVIAVIDGGFSNVNNIPAFDYIRDNGQLLGTWDFVMNEENVYDDNNHGTNVLSCMAGFIDGAYLGTAPKASYWLLRSEDTGSETISEEYNWLAAAEYADSVGADMINSSLGYTTFDNPDDNHTYEQMDGNTTVVTKAADIAASKGILVVNSAGNSGNSGWHYIGAPADGDSVLSVGAVTDKREKASFSSFGPSADGRIKPDVDAMGQNASVINTSGGINGANGTSFSGPILCGAAASLWSKNTGLSNMEVIDAIRKSAHLYAVPTDGLGYGIPNFGVADMVLGNTNFDSYFENQEIKVFPNPVVDNFFYLDYYSNYTETIRIEITSTKGKIIYTKEMPVYAKSLYTIPVTMDKRPANGVYVFNVYASGKRFTTKFVKL